MVVQWSDGRLARQPGDDARRSIRNHKNRHYCVSVKVYPVTAVYFVLKILVGQKSG